MMILYWLDNSSGKRCILAVKEYFHLNIEILSVYENIFCSFDIDGVCWYLSLSSPKVLPVVNPLVSVDPQTWTFLWQQIKAAGFQMLFIISIILKKSQRTTKKESKKISTNVLILIVLTVWTKTWKRDLLVFEGTLKTESNLLNWLE